MGLNPPVPQQDSNWEIRAAVLLSLFFQVVLIFLGPARKRLSAPLFRLVVWSSYLLADWVADLALGLILNNIGGAGGTASSSSPVIFAFWTPFLLLHLGGPDTITAYSVEDNELWNRHLIGLLFEVFSACVIIFCSLRGNPLVLATMLMLVAGVIKYGERTYSFYAGSTESLRDSILGPPEPGPNYSRLMTEFDSKQKAGLVVQIDIANGEAEEAHKQMEKQETKRWVLDDKKSLEARAYEFFLTFRRLLVDVILSFKERRRSQAIFLEWTLSEVFEVMEVELNFMYDMLYTKAPVAYSRCGWVLRCICSGCLASALAVFFFLDKPGHKIQRVDVGITYALLLGGLALDEAALLMLIFSNRTKVYLEESLSSRWMHWLEWLRRVTNRWQTRRWSGTVTQMNLIRYCQEKPGPSYSGSSNNRGAKLWLMIVMVLGIEEIVDDFFFVRRVRLKKDEEECCGCLGRFFRERLVPKCCKNKNSMAESLLFRFIFRGLEHAQEEDDIEQEKEQERKMAAARKLKKEQEKDDIEAETDLAVKDAIAAVCRRRGDGVVKKRKDKIIEGTRMTTTMEQHGHGSGEDRFKVILDSVVKSEFDESLLLWHIATDLCRLEYKARAQTAHEALLRPIAVTLSEYMLYLLIKQPDMLAATAGIGLLRYRDTRAEARRFFDSMAEWNPGHKEAWRMLLNVNTTKKPVEVKGDRSKSVLFDAVILAKKLRELDEEVMWDVIMGVWGEMLTFAAFRGRGRTHLRSLNCGGELITLVWLLMQHVGLSDKHESEVGDPRVKLNVRY